LVIFDPHLFKGHTPIFNPFDIDKKDPQSIEVATSQFIKTFKDTIKGGDTVSSTMEVFLNPIISTLFRKKGADFRDLRDFLDENKNADLIEYGKLTTNEGHRIFFDSYINDKSYKVTRDALLKKIQELLNSQIFVNLTSGQTTVKLSQLINENYIVIFNLSKQNLGEDISNLIGRLIIAQIQSIGMQRRGDFRPKTFVYIDEFQNYVSDSIRTILTESRKYGLHFTLAQQNRGQEMNKELEDIVLNNTKIKIQGLIDDNVKGVIRGSDDVKLKTGEFLAKITGKEKVKITVPKTYLGNKFSYKKDDFERIKAQQKQYYKLINKREFRESEIITTGNAPKYDL
jgi:DNA helicase HerA-like ATPase